METFNDAPLEDGGASFEADTPDVDVAVDDGQGGGDEAPAEPNILDLSEFSDAVVQVGDELVPVSELPNGFLRQSDYTRKTQEVAEQRKELERAATLQRALEANPQGTLQFLSEQYGITLGEAKALASDVDDGWGEVGEFEGTEAQLAQRLESLERRIQQEEATKAVESAFSGLEAKYGDDFNRTQVAQRAYELGVYDPSYFEMIYRDMKFDELMGRQAAQSEVQTKQQAEEAARRAAAQQAASAESASGATNTTAAAPSRPLTIREAMQLAEAQLQSR